MSWWLLMIWSNRSLSGPPVAHISAVASTIASSMRWPPNVLIPLRITVPFGNRSFASRITAFAVEKCSTAG